MYKDWQNWVLQNMVLLSKIFGKCGVMLNGKTWQSILILRYPLPPSWAQRTSRLLIVLPDKSRVFYAPPDRFYLDQGLRTIHGKKPAHYFENDRFNDLRKSGLARFSFHVKGGWCPRKDCRAGTNLVDVLDAFHTALIAAANEV